MILDNIRRMKELGLTELGLCYIKLSRKIPKAKKSRKCDHLDEEYLREAEVGDGGGDVLDEEYFSEAEEGVGGGAGAELDEEPVPLAIKVQVLSWLGGVHMFLCI